MSNLLRRDLSPVADEAWKMLDDFASAILRQRLSGRKVVDFSGPHGLEFSAVNVGTLRPSEKAADGVGWGIRQVLPLIETRVPFSLGQWELDDISRGRRDPDLKPLEEAVMKAAEFEDAAVFHGFEGGRIEGLLAATPHKPVAMPGKIDGLPAAIGEAIKKITQAGIGGPFAVVLGVNPYVELASTMPCCVPLLKTVGDLAGGPVVPSGVLNYPPSGVIYVNDNVWVEGANLSGRITIACSGQLNSSGKTAAGPRNIMVCRTR